MRKDFFSKIKSDVLHWKMKPPYLNNVGQKGIAQIFK